MRCVVYGLTLDVEPPIPGLRSTSDNSAVDVLLRLEPRRGVRVAPPRGDRWYESDWLDESTGAPGLTIYRSPYDGAFTICYSDGLAFEVDSHGRTVAGSVPDALTLTDVANRITGPVLGFLLRLRGVVALHASVVEIDGGAVAFVGDARAGKSTMAAVFAREGYRVVTEDVAALSDAEGSFAVCAGCTDVALRPDAVAQLFGSADALPRISTAWDKRRLDVSDVAVSATTPLRAVYILTNRPVVPDAPCVRPIAAADAIVELLANVYGNRLLHAELRARELDVLHRLVARIPVREAATGARPELIPRFRDVLLDDVRAR